MSTHQKEPVAIPLSQGQYALVDTADAERVLAEGKWSANFRRYTFYAVRTFRKDDGKRTVMAMHTFLTGYKQTDHINGNGLDNRRTNLREVTTSENAHNSRRRVNNTSGFIGVSWNKRERKWYARIMLNGKREFLGLYANPEAAAYARDEAAKELHGEFARLNFPNPTSVPFGGVS